MRFLVAVISVPLIYLAVLMGAQELITPTPPAIPAAPAAIAFALVITSPSTRAAAVRTGALLVGAVLFALAAHAL